MKTNKILCFIAMVCLSMATATKASAQAIARDEAIENQVKEILSKMTLDDKVGQMLQMNLDCVAEIADPKAGWLGPDYCSDRFSLSEERMKNCFDNYKVGSILNIPNSIAARPELWQSIIRTLNQRSMDACNGVPQVHGVDMIHGASYTWGATLFPQEVGQGASFNRSIAKRIGEISAYETRASCVPWIFSPVMDVARSPLWPRLWESYGEDWFLNSQMAMEQVYGLQGKDPNHIGMYGVAACLKHYLAYGAAVSGKDRTPSSVTERELLEKYFQPFKACIEAGALSIMVNSANNNGIPFHANHKLLTEWLKDGLQWDGVIVTDWGDIDNLWKRDHIAADKKDAIRQAINAGVDMSMDPYDLNFCTLLKELVQEGKVPMSRIDDAVSRIVRMKIRLGLLDKKTWDMPYKKFSKLYPDFASDKFTQEARRMTQECMVLLKNEQPKGAQNAVLPLQKGQKLLVFGPNSNRFRPMSGGWTYTWQGDKTDSVCNIIGKYHTFLGALKEKFGEENIMHRDVVAYDDAKGWEAEKFNEQELAEAKQMAAQADVIVAFLGENTYTETVGNTNSLELSSNQKLAALSVIAAAENKPFVIVLNEGRPRLLGELADKADAIVQTFLPSLYGGDALADLLAGDANFSGKLPYTYPKHTGSFATYDYKPCENMATIDGAYNYDAKMDVLYPFGHGLSYTTFEYSDLKVEVSDDAKSYLTPQKNPIAGCKAEGYINVSVTVKNTGNVAGKEPVLVFVSDMVASLTPDVKRLRAFKKVTLEPGESRVVTQKIKVRDLAFVNSDMQWVVEPGDFRIAVGNQSTTITLE